MLQGHNIGDAIKRQKLQDRSQKTVSGISRQRVQRIIRGESKATIKELERICDAYGLQIIAVKTEKLPKISQILSILGENCEKIAE